ncbi:low-density lipoprotein receptor class A domain-containing protein 4-like isoform X4 [Phyllopteryx taeniolatus]|uniref:low-density lipoprotein receptor class A domain-containing protein 4-like isoform X4 n=1 Tax=Phyllopteryx taeniolatus TaxID=161469 RepID=UPI002AD585F9|nr:low-density lipoprotein receptor class A domain-containing protein 4-like isoform X4 [Phyllopteryx taeniolatus]
MQETDSPDINAFKECKFHCTNGNCLRLGSLICNQLNNCGDNSDEENCPMVTQHPPAGIFNSELEFVQIIIIIVVMTVMVVVIICLLNHYKLSTFITRQSQARRHNHSLQQVLYAPQPRDRFTAPAFMHRDRFSRFQPTYPYLQHQIDLPPTISLSDGEEPPPYQGPCTLQLRDPEQQMELNRESVRAPPNRTIYDSDLIDMGGGGVAGGGGSGPRPPSSNSGISVANCGIHGRMEAPPPAYSEVIGQYPGSTFFLHQQSNNLRVGESGVPGSRMIQQQSQSESTIVPSKAKDGQPEDLV